jgi:hypothetical protein
MSFLVNRYFLAVGVPIVFLLCGSVAKKLVRGVGWRRSDFFLGVEASLAAISSGLINIFDLVKVPIAQAESKIAATGGFLVITFFLLFRSFCPSGLGGQTSW